MTGPFSAEEILNKYKSLGLKPVRSRFYAVYSDDGIIGIDPSGKCCALTAAMDGYKSQKALEITSEANLRWPGFDAWSFVAGFDGATLATAKQLHNSKATAFSEESYSLGVECRLALEQEFGSLTLDIKGLFSGVKV